MIKRKLNGRNCNADAAAVFAASSATGPAGALIANELATNEKKKCVCRNNAEWYYNNNSWAQYGGDSASVYSWAYQACTTNPLRDLGSSSSENSYLYYQKYLEAKTGTGPGGFTPITPTPGGAPAGSGGGTGTQQTKPNLLIPALIGAAILFLPFP